MAEKTFHSRHFSSQAKGGNTRENGKPALTLYVGIALSLGWFYCIWFVPEVFQGIELLDWNITVLWLTSLGVSAAAMFLIPLALREKRHLIAHRSLVWISGITMSVGSLIVMMGTPIMRGIWSGVIATVLMSVASAVLWILWGEYYTTLRVSYFVEQVAPTVGSVVLGSIVLAIVLPAPVNCIFIASLPILSSWLLFSVLRKSPKPDFPPLLPKPERTVSMRSILIVCGIAAGASSACYFTVAIIPVWDLTWDSTSFTYGAIVGSIVLILIGCACKLLPNKINIFRLFPWLLTFSEFAILLYFSNDTRLFTTSFITALCLSTIFEVLLLMYIGVLSTKGYIPPALSFGFSGGFIRAGILVGNGVAIIFEQFPEVEDVMLEPTTLFFACALVFMLIPLIRREDAIIKLTAPVSSLTDIDKQVEMVVKEFNLSEREGNVLQYLARGYTAEGIGKKLFISSFTVQTHIQHIYAKTGIHKRSNLIDYVTKREVANEDAQGQERDNLPTNWPLPS